MKKKISLIYQKCGKLFSGTGISKNKNTRKLIDYFNTKLKQEFVEINGNKIYLDNSDSLFLSVHGHHEKTETNLVIKEIKNGDTVIDIGANIGYYTLLFAKLVGPNGKVYAFEPEPNNFKLLKKNIDVNSYHNVIIEQKAISNKNQEETLYLSNSSTANHLYKPEKNIPSLQIKSITLDEYFKNSNQKINFVKIDISGAEPLAIEGMEKTLSKNPNCKIMQEWWPDAIKKYNVEPDTHLRRLEELGYIFYEIDDKQEKLNLINIDSLLKKYPNSELEDINLFCKRESLS